MSKQGSNKISAVEASQSPALFVVVILKTLKKKEIQLLNDLLTIFPQSRRVGLISLLGLQFNYKACDTK